MKILLLAISLVSIGCIHAQDTKLASPIVVLPPSAGGVTPFGPQADAGSNLGTAAKRFNILEGVTVRTRSAASANRYSEVSGGGINGYNLAAQNTFTFSTTAGTGGFGGNVTLYDGNTGANGTSLAVYGGLAAAYTLTLPSALPGSTLFLTVTAAGQMGYSAGGGSPPFIDTTPIVYNSLDPTGKVALKANLITTGTTRNITAQDFDYEIAARNHTQTFSAAQTFAANILTTSGINIGTAANPFADNYLTQVYTESQKLCSTATTFGTCWTMVTSGYVLTLSDNTPATYLTFNAAVVGAHTARVSTFVSDLWPSADLTYDLGTDITNGGSNHGWRKGFIATIYTDTINSLSTVLTLNGAGSTNGNILLQPGNVAANSSVYAIAPRLDQPALILTDASGTTTSNSLEFRTFGGTVYAKMIGGTDSGAPGFFGTGGFFCITSGSCDAGFTSNRFAHVYAKVVDIDNASATGLIVNSTSTPTIATFTSSGTAGNDVVQISSSGTGNASAAKIHNNASTAGAIGAYNLGTGPDIALGASPVGIKSSSGAPTGGCTTGSLYLRNDGGTNTTLYVCESSAWVAK